MATEEISIQEGTELVRLARTSVEAYIKNKKIFSL